jgi:DNA-binding LytR/AlgR family response regulator
MSKNILIVEDDYIIADMIAQVLEKNGHHVIGKAEDVMQAVAYLEKGTIDIALLDVGLQGDLNGIDLAKKIKSSYDLPFIFLTSSIDKNTLEKVSETGASGFLSKPFKTEDLLMSIHLATRDEELIADVPDELFSEYLFVKQRGIYQKFAFDDILWFKASGIYTEIHTRKDTIVIRSLLGEVANKLSNTKFLRIHKSYIVNISCVTSVDSKHIFLNETPIPISRNMQSLLVSKMKLI